MKMKECEFPMIDRSLTMAQRAWRGKHPDWISDHFYMGSLFTVRWLLSGDW